MSSWTDGDVDTLKTLWTEGLSCSQIARAMSAGRDCAISRNAVIGKATRLGLSSRAGVQRTASHRVPAAPRVRRAVEPPAIAIELPPLTLEDGRRVGVMEINDRMCRWPIGDPATINTETPDFYFCARTPHNEGPYCIAHSQKARNPVPWRIRPF